MARFPRFRFLALAVIFHLIYIYSIFDIYFVSPVVSGMRLFSVERPAPSKAPADRLVLFVGDGLRADKALQSHPEPYPASDADLEPRPLAPFLRSRILEHGTFGVSHTRVPTESRPGHVALIAGLYEDVSAVTTGWKLNPVDFDSVFNRSQHTWSWGSPDILPMFEHGAVPGRVDAYTYGAEAEDFSQDATHLDLWVFDRVKALFEEAAQNKTLRAALKEDKIVFFLHLLGLDTTGHFYRPYSKEYLHNIKIVDQGVREITEVVEKFYNDDRTAYVFTADHEIHPGTVAPGHDEYSFDWDLDQVRRHDVSQADVAALMAYLTGAAYPANSVGELPLPYLAADISEKAESLLVNAQGILEMYRVKEETKKASQLRFRPYQPLSEHGRTSEERVAAIRGLIKDGKYEEAIEETEALIQFGLQGLSVLAACIRYLVFISLIMPLAYRLESDSNYLHRLVVIFLTCAPTFVIFTISYEGLFYVAFWVTLLAWVRLEYEVYTNSTPKVEVAVESKSDDESTETKQVPDRLPNPHRPLSLADARVALFFFVFLQSAFFSTGNVASVSSFSLESVCRLIPIFDPFSQGILLILKLMIPFALVSANLGILNKRIGVAPSALFMVVMAISDILTLYFFWVVKDEGSWLEIGSTISHFVIASLLSVFVAALEGVSAWFISGVEMDVLGVPGKTAMNGQGTSDNKTQANGTGTAAAAGKPSIGVAEKP
ncbi:putative gpi ethanolamine phosphate transferase 1 [Diaporthe ampelina]|uniref:GPI ethanolamine phosphate transferase 1 n=1 Tax=Diaporthe ampelina TaxID=1214573 RepID=A0A0G2FTM1_9PEZI|nr:putative gpi ethanolamine phosphate transferase 1 [Diaporthe ampelina]